MKYKHDKETLLKAVENSISIADVCRILGIVPRGGNYKTLKKKIREYGIDNSHFLGQGWNKGERFRFFGKRAELDDVLIENSTFLNTSHLRKRLIQEGIKKEECENCHNTIWMGVKIPLELEHINGINTDNRKENLKLLCPNCHALTPTYRGKSKKKHFDI